MSKHKIYTMSFASVYPHYVAKAERKKRPQHSNVLPHFSPWLHTLSGNVPKHYSPQRRGQYASTDEFGPPQYYFNE